MALQQHQSMIKAGHAGPVQPEQHTRLSTGLHASQAEQALLASRGRNWSFILGLLEVVPYHLK